jgi:hypothetical protein
MEFSKVIESKENLNFELFKRIIGDVRVFFPVIAFNLTEPLLNKHIARYVNYTSKNKLNCDLTTNGYLLEEHAEELVKASLSVLNVSIDGTSDIHNRIRGVADSFERASKGISAVIDAKRRFGKEYPKIYLAFVITRNWGWMESNSPTFLSYHLQWQRNTIASSQTCMRSDRVVFR